MATPKPICRTVAADIRATHGRSVFAPLTGQDARAFEAFVHLLDLYIVSEARTRAEMIVAMALTIRAMQVSTSTTVGYAIDVKLGDGAAGGRLWQELIAECNRWHDGERGAPPGMPQLAPIEECRRLRRRIDTLQRENDAIRLRLEGTP